MKKKLDFFLFLKVRHPGRKTSSLRTVRILKICRTSGPDVMSGRALADTRCTHANANPAKQYQKRSDRTNSVYTANLARQHFKSTLTTQWYQCSLTDRLSLKLRAKSYIDCQNFDNKQCLPISAKDISKSETQC